MIEESEAARTLRLAREAQGKKPGGSSAGKVILFVFLGFVGLFAFAIVASEIDRARDPEGYAKRQAEREAARQVEAAAEASKAADEEKASAADPEAEMKGALADNSRQSLWIIKSKEGITAKLKDPDSADFRNVHFYSGSGRPIVCGEVNAKNSFGGYSGFEPFVASGTDLAFLASEMSSPQEMTAVWQKFCVRAPTDTE